MGKSKGIALALLIGLGFIAVLNIAWKAGQQRHVYDLQRFAEPIPIPILHQSYTAKGAWEDTPQANRIRILWNPVQVPAAWREERKLFQCIGSIKRSETFTAYVLVYENQLFIEKDTLIEPLIKGYEYYKQHGKYPDDPFEVLKPDHYQKE